MGKAETFITLAFTCAAVVAACGGKVVFVAQGNGGAGGAGGAGVTSTTYNTVTATTASFGPTNVSVGTCMTCDCMPGGCTDAETSVATSGVGGGTSSCVMTCFDVLTGQGNGLCPNAPAAAQTAFDALATCICDPAQCGGPAGQCALTCAMMVETNLSGCSSCEMMTLAGACATQASACAAN